MERRLLSGLAVWMLLCAGASGQGPHVYPPVGVNPAYGPVPGSGYEPVPLNGGAGVQLYPFDQQDPWLHGYFQRYPAYGGYAAFRPYNYRHVYSQSQVAGYWGSPHGMPYSQQFWNRYRGSYMEGMLHDRAPANTSEFMNIPANPIPGGVNPIGYRRGSESNPGRAAEIRRR
jgi:hypothetical protein